MSDMPSAQGWAAGGHGPFLQPATIRGLEYVLDADAVDMFSTYVEYRTGGHCVIGRHPLGGGRVLVQVFTYLLPPEDIEVLRQEVSRMAWKAPPGQGDVVCNGRKDR